jgi:hypothetical protein
MAALHKPGTIYQAAFLVDDLEKAAAYWCSRGAGPFYLFEDFQFTTMLHPAGAVSPRLSILLGYSGDIMIELIRVIEDSTGLFSSLAAPASHHFAVLVDDIETYVAQDTSGAELVMHGLFPTGTPIGMLDTRPHTGALTELVTLDDSVRAMIEQMRGDAENFSGERLIRSFG